MELSPDLANLCLAAGTTLVNSMTSDAWAAARDAFLGFLVRNGDPASRELRLDSDREALRLASDDEKGLLADKTSAIWATRLEDLVERNPEAITELASLIKLIGSMPGSNAVTNAGVQQQAGDGGLNIFSGRDTKIG
ncbi:hypothetical protein [Micromonospora haikouensis]|uniref:hypothetical protein n=1 Tax=Micromonospora haikouensis TaxID=686309 RepID=UPI003D73ADA6